MRMVHERQVRMIPIEQIIVVNPRTRSRRKFAQISANIRKIGLKRPVSVVEDEPRNGVPTYLLACGQGRLEAYRDAGETHVPAIVINVPREVVLLISLAENIARRRQSAVELVREVGKQRERGYTFSQIAQKTDLDVGYVRGVITLLNKGEERLLRAVERGEIPLYLAIQIATADDKAVQAALIEAYEKNTLRGKALIRARQLIETRRSLGKAGGRRSRTNGVDTISANQLVKAYEAETLKQKMVVQKARLCEMRLTFSTEALKKLFRDPNFVTLLRAENLLTLPQFLATRITVMGG